MPRAPRRVLTPGHILLVALFSLVLQANCCTELRYKSPDPNYVPTVMSPAPFRPLVIAVDISHDNLHQIANCAASYLHFDTFYTAQGHLVGERIPGTAYAVLDPVTELPVPADVFVIPTPLLTFTPAQIADALAFVEAGGGILLMTDHGPDIPFYARTFLQAFGIGVDDTSVVCGNPIWCPLAPNTSGVFTMNQTVPYVYTYEGTSFPQPERPEATCVFEFASDATDLVTGASVEGRCQSVATTRGCGKLFAAGSVEMFTAYVNLTFPHGLGDANNPHAEAFAYAVMEWVGTPLEAGEGTCAPAS